MDKYNKIAVVSLLFALLALSNDTTLYQDITTLLTGNYVNKTGDTMSGDLNMGGHDLFHVGNMTMDGLRKFNINTTDNLGNVSMLGQSISSSTTWDVAFYPGTIHKEPSFTFVPDQGNNTYIRLYGNDIYRMPSDYSRGVVGMINNSNMYLSVECGGTYTCGNVRFAGSKNNSFDLRTTNGQLDTSYVMKVTNSTGQIAGITGIGNIYTKALSGTGNAYVCVDSTGKMYRSSVVCV